MSLFTDDGDLIESPATAPPPLPGVRKPEPPARRPDPLTINDVGAPAAGPILTVSQVATAIAVAIVLAWLVRS